MSKKNILVSLATATMLFTACGGGGGGTSGPSVTPETITFVTPADTIKVMPGKRKSMKLSVGKDLYDPNGFLYSFKILEVPDDITDAVISDDGILVFSAPNGTDTNFTIKVQAKAKDGSIGTTVLNFVTADTVTNSKVVVKTGANDGGSGIDRSFSKDTNSNIAGVKGLVWADKSRNVPTDPLGKSYESAKDYCEKTLSNIDGGGWRLPTIDELLDTVNYSKVVGEDGSYVYDAFTIDLLTSWAEMQNGKKYYLHNVSAVILEDNTNKFMTRCVKGDKETTEHLVYVGDIAGDTFDLSTNLQWSPAETKKATEAESYCSGLNHNGHDDWRLPSINELRSIVENGSVSSFITKGTQLISATPYNDNNTSSNLNWGIWLNADVTTSVAQMYMEGPEPGKENEYPITCVRTIN